MSGRESFLGLIVAALAATISFHPGLQTEAMDPQHAVIDIRNLEFVPKAPVLKPGDVIIWVNKDIVPHTVTAVDGSWGSGRLDQSGEWRMVVGDGLFESYFCKYHPSMTARLNIEPQ